MTIAGSPSDADFMGQALLLAAHAAQNDEVPVGALVVAGNEIVGEGWNCPIGSCDPTAHAEIVALRKAASRTGNYRLDTATLYVTLEPCPMCIGAIINARIRRLVFGAWDAKAGACGSVLDVPRSSILTRSLDVFGGVGSAQSSELLRQFFTQRR